MMTMTKSKKTILLLTVVSLLLAVLLITVVEARMISYEQIIADRHITFSLPAFLDIRPSDDGSYEILQRGQVVGAVRYITAPDTDTEDFRQLSQYIKAFYGQENGSFWSFQGGEDQRIYDVAYATGETRADFCYSTVCVVPENELILFDLYADLIGIEWFRRSILGSVAASDIPKT
jgi:hypothetical protein